MKAILEFVTGALWVLMNSKNDQRIVPGISVTTSGQATVDPSLADVLFDLAIQLEEPTNLPVDVEHVLAAIVLAARKGDIDQNKPLSSNDPGLVAILTDHVKTVFAHYGGNRACDFRQGDYIQMPHKSSFTSDSGFFEVMSHELAHWSEKRLGWEDSHAMGELVAEMSACFVAKELCIPQSGDFVEQHTSYLAGWLTKLESDPKFIFKASTQASKATDFLLAFRNQTAIKHELDEVPF